MKRNEELLSLFSYPTFNFLIPNELLYFLWHCFEDKKRKSADRLKIACLSCFNDLKYDFVGGVNEKKSWI